MTKNSNSKNRTDLNPWLLWVADLMVIWLAVIILECIFHSNIFGYLTRLGILLATIAYIPACIYVRHRTIIERSISIDRVFGNSFKTLGMHALVFMSLCAFLHVDFSITFYILFYCILGVMFPLINIICRLWVKRLRRKGNYITRVAIVGTNPSSTRLSETLLRDEGFGYRIVGHFDGEKLPDFKGNYIGDFDELDRYARNNMIDEIFFTNVGSNEEHMRRSMNIAQENMLKFYYVPQISKYINSIFELKKIGAVPVMTLTRNPLSYIWNRGIKRTFDIAFSSLVLLFSPIVLIPVAIAIKLSSPGPIFFVQERTGFKGKSFRCYKFRTMKVNADADKAQATANDPRKTKVGDFLRKTSIDELPQFFNVWKGDMSVVGPRPHMLKHTEDYTRLIDQYMVRHIVKPGITGWAQVNGYRGITDQLWKMEKRVEFDVWYIENWSISLDIKIIIRTVMNALHGEKNAF